MKKEKVVKNSAKGESLMHSLPPKDEGCSCAYPFVLRKGFGGDKQIVEVRLCCLAAWAEAQGAGDVLREFTEQ